MLGLRSGFGIPNLGEPSDGWDGSLKGYGHGLFNSQVSEHPNPH